MVNVVKKTVVFFADGFEECEGLIVVDILRRAGVNVLTASIMGRKEITSSHNVTIQADVLVEHVDFSEVDLIVLPGGLPGTVYLSENEVVKKQCQIFAEDKLVSAICAAPSILASLGIINSRPVTCHPAFETKMADAIITHDPVTVSDNIITGQGLGAAIPFALKLVEILVDKETSSQIAKAISYVEK